MLPVRLRKLSAEVLAAFRSQGWRVATAESCTGGLIAGTLTETAGSSDVFERGFVTYSNEAKQQVLGVPQDVLLTHGAVSEATARAMAEGAIARSEADVAVAVTGVAGPGGGSAEKPVGLVHLATTRRGAETQHRRMSYNGLGREGVRLATVETALEMLLERAGRQRQTASVGLRLGGAQTAILFLGALAVMVASGVIALPLARMHDITMADGTAFMALIGLLPSLALLAWIYGWSTAKSAERDPLLGLRRLTPRWTLFGILGGVAGAAASWLIILVTQAWFGEPFNLFSAVLTKSREITLALVLISLLVGIVLAPLWEEIAFRGVLYGWLRGRTGIALAAALTALGHSLLHFDPAVVPALFLVFIWFALLFEWSRNLWVPILAHATNNALAFLYAFMLLK